MAVSAMSYTVAHPSRPRLKFSGETPEPQGLALSCQAAFIETLHYFRNLIAKNQQYNLD
jgi:hypothetical protein